MRFILLGPPGAGKGTLAKELKKSFDLWHISTGDILREEMKRKSDLGLQIQAQMDSGNLVSDEIVTKIIKECLQSSKADQLGFMLDGYPRTVQQAQDLDQILSEINKPIDLVLYLESTPKVILKRLMGRRICKDCGALFHIKNRPPKVENQCDYCGSEIIKRDDDNEETIKNRMMVYLENTIPLINFYDCQRKVKKLSSDRETNILIQELVGYFDET